MVAAPPVKIPTLDGVILGFVYVTVAFLDDTSDDIPAVQNGATVILDERTVAIEELPPGTEEQVGCETEDGPEAGDAVDDDEALVGVVTVGVVIAVAAIDGLLLVPIEDTHEHTALADDWT